MTSPISSAQVAPQQAAAAPAATKAAVKPAADNDSTTHVEAAGKTKVTISAAAQAAAAADKEAMETPAQTAQEARGNDMQAKLLLAKEQAAAKAAQG